MPHLIVMTYSAPPFCSAKRFRKGSGPEAIAARWGDHRSTGQRGPLASIPSTLQIGGLAVVVLGTPRHALDAFRELAQAKVPVATMATLRERPLAQTQSLRRKACCAQAAHISTSVTTRSGARGAPLLGYRA